MNPAILKSDEPEDDEDIADSHEDELEDEVMLTRTSKSKSFWMGGEISSDVGKRQFKKLFENNADFPYPKSIGFFKRCLNIGLENNEIVLDFFAGSAGIAQAVLEMNAGDGNSRKFICVQLPEPLDESTAKNNEDKAIIKKNIDFLKAHLKPLNIAELSKERIKRAIASIKRQKLESSKLSPIDLFERKSDRCPEIDLGFKVFKLDRSNFKIWDANIEKTENTVQSVLELHVNHLSVEASQQSVLYEILLKSGFELTTSIKELEIEGNTVYSIADGELLICLEKNLTKNLIRAIAEKQPTRVICLDEGFQNNDQLKTNAVQIMKSKNVVSFRTV